MMRNAGTAVDSGHGRKTRPALRRIAAEPEVNPSLVLHGRCAIGLDEISPEDEHE